MECTICGKETKYVPNKKFCKICKRAASNARRIKALKLPENIIAKRKSDYERRNRPGYLQDQKSKRIKLAMQRKKRHDNYMKNREEKIAKQTEWNKANKDKIADRKKQKERRKKHFKGEK